MYNILLTGAPQQFGATFIHAADIYHVLQNTKEISKIRNLFIYFIIFFIAVCPRSLSYRSPPICAKSGANTTATIVMSLIRMLIDGPDVSLNGSPTVSPTTAAW